jgi:HTH-type transcriptional regulator / antitoxin HipB
MTTETDLRKQIGKRIRQAREARTLTQQQLADRLGKNSSTVSNYESGVRTVKVMDLPGLGEALDVPLEYFFTEDVAARAFLDGLPDSEMTQVAALHARQQHQEQQLQTVLSRIEHLEQSLPTADLPPHVTLTMERATLET